MAHFIHQGITSHTWLYTTDFPLCFYSSSGRREWGLHPGSKIPGHKIGLKQASILRISTRPDSICHSSFYFLNINPASRWKDPNTKDLKTLNLKLGTWNLEYGICKLEAGIYNQASGIWNLEPRTWNLEPRTWYLETKTWYFESGIWNHMIFCHHKFHTEAVNLTDQS